MTIEIKDRYKGEVLHTVEAETLTGAELSGADLRGADLRGADLSGANLTGADLYKAELSGADLSEAELSEAELSRANLSGANLYRANLYEANLYEAIGNMREVKSLQCYVWPITYTADILQIGCQRHKIERWWSFSDAQIAAMHGAALEWWRVWKPILQQTIAASPAVSTGREGKND